MNLPQQKHFQQRIARACDYIAQNLDEDLTLELISQVAACSKFHFQRIFSAHIGISVMRFMQMSRLKRASFRLAFEKQKRLIDIAFEAGFESPEAFSRAFKREFGQTPSEFRAKPCWPDWQARFDFKPLIAGDGIMNVEIVEFASTPVARLVHIGPPEKVLETAGRFIAWRKETGLSPVKSSQTFGIAYSDPKTSDPKTFRWDICGSMQGPVPENQYGVEAAEIPGGRCVKVQHRGSHDCIDQTIYPVYREWLPDSGEQLRDFPCFFHYLNFIHEVDECDLLTDIYIPIQ